MSWHQYIFQEMFLQGCQTDQVCGAVTKPAWQFGHAVCKHFCVHEPRACFTSSDVATFLQNSISFVVLQNISDVSFLKIVNIIYQK
jgi:hypothetical protein